MVNKIYRGLIYCGIYSLFYIPAVTWGSNLNSSQLLSTSTSSSPLPTSSYHELVQVNFKSLLKEFISAQKAELKALEHRHKLEMKELKASQELRLKEWDKKELEARHLYFDHHLNGQERRDYIKDFIQRRDNFRKLLNEEKKQNQKDYEINLAELSRKQFDKLEKFKKLIESNQIPPKNLWPQAGT